MYIVKVYIDSREYPQPIDTRTFVYGTWREIGYWLDEYGYNDPQYHVLINFTER